MGCKKLLIMYNEFLEDSYRYTDPDSFTLTESLEEFKDKYPAAYDAGFTEYITHKYKISKGENYDEN